MCNSIGKTNNESIEKICIASSMIIIAICINSVTNCSAFLLNLISMSIKLYMANVVMIRSI